MIYFMIYIKGIDIECRSGLVRHLFFSFDLYRNFCISRMPYLLVGLYSLDLQLSICTLGICNFDSRDSPAVIYDIDTKGATIATHTGLVHHGIGATRSPKKAKLTTDVVRHETIKSKFSAR